MPDLSGRNNHASTNNMDASGYASGLNGLAFRFDGVNDFVGVFESSFANFGSAAFTVSIWLRAAPFAAPTALFSKDDWDSGSTGLLIYTNEPNLVYYFSSSGANSFGAICDNTWHHIAIARASTSANATRLFLDGRLLKTITDTRNYTNTRRLRLGNDDDGNRPWPGLLDDARISNRQLTDYEIQTLAIEPGIGLRPERTSVFFGAQLFQPAWLAQSRNIIGGGVC